ncbi:MAG: hypothetical protein NWR61_02680 [Pseudomonadales bacterium]|jgi:hypothetical protein|nr:hypothetical protein [Pseudomonadales bacterium]MDP4639920.1 hypothetical protein [Pseudomonadales bacterium]MDP4765231.1 hypothetical protein [Pseudomonadales bacterium]MDP4874820.1 hypothetical protein [Pseudomonadales bacterium]MDP4911823.1 hypothetical protein [Pseudomonadales bacterium]
MMQYGFQRLVLLGSAGYARAELPLDASVSLIAPNNTGKTSLINALQFLLIIDRNRMDFGAHAFDKTRRFYFPGNSAYILLEVSLPQTGTVVLGCVGKGVSHEYEYFAYQGPLLVDDFRLADDTLVAQPQLTRHLAQRQRLVFKYNGTEFRNLIYGGQRARGSQEPDFTVFKLEHASDAQAFQRVLTRTLRLDKLKSTDVKAYLLQIFKRDLPDANIDFKQEWDKAFAEVNAERAQYAAAVRQLSRIRSIEQEYEERRQLRGKLIQYRPRVDQGLVAWQAHFQQQAQLLAARILQLNDAQRQQTAQDRECVVRREQLRGALDIIEQDNAHQATLAQRFALVSARKQLEDEIAAVQQQLDRHTTRLGQVGSRSEATILREQQQRQLEYDQLEQQRLNLGDNLYRRLSEALPAEQLERLNRVLSPQVMTLAPASVLLDSQALQQALRQSAPGQLQLPGLAVSLATLRPLHEQLTSSELEERLVDSRQQLQGLAEQLDIARQLAQAQQKKLQLEQQKRLREQDLADYDQWQLLVATALARQTQQALLRQQLDEVQQALAEATNRAEALLEQLDQVRQQSQQLTQQHKIIEGIRNQRGDGTEQFTFLDQLDHAVWLADPEWRLEDLAERLQAYQRDCRQLQELDRSLHTGLTELHGGGLTKYQYSDSPDRELQAIISFSQQLPQEQQALEKKARSAVVNVTASLRELRDGLLAFKGKMREFNRLLGHRQLSDLKTFKIEPADETHLVEAIEKLISTAAQVSAGDSFELFNQASVLDDTQLERAKQLLIDEGNARSGLKVADLFRLEFVVAKVDQAPESFQDIDSAASNGTVLMAKLVTGLAMLHLMQDQRHKVRAICYLDEALALDARNQTSLIDTASEFGFALIFASPAPLTTVRYCVPIHHHQGMNHISAQNWQVLESLAEPIP